MDINMENITLEEYRRLSTEEAYSTPLEEFNMSDPKRFEKDSHWAWFKRLREEDPVHWCKDSALGPYWSVTKFNDIMTVDTNHQIFSSEPSITLLDPSSDFSLPMFIAMDPPKHDAQRKVVSPIVAPQNLAKLESLIRERVCKILDDLPINETFNWVDRVSVELTTQMLATLFDFPWEDRRKLTYWSDIALLAPVIHCLFL
jgi:cytochrome P450